MSITAARRIRDTSLRALLAAAGVLIVFAFVFHASPAPAATAALSCPGTIENPFRPWLDPANYVLAPAGDFERASGWQLSYGAKTVLGNEPFLVHGRSDARSLMLPAGASALSPSFCIGLFNPTVRLFATGRAGSRLRVDVVYGTALGTLTQPVGLVAPGSWAPTLPMVLLANVTGLTNLSGTTWPVRLKFTSTGSADLRIDDVYVDPWKIH
jgi:hypothetical protein